ncbi:MAG: hypothetical protein PVG30_07170 [Gammaproteobacteria bacterium]
MQQHFNLMGYSIEDFVETFPHTAHVKDADTCKYVLTNFNNLKLFGFEKKQDLVGKTVFDLAEIMKEKWPKDYADNIQAYDNQIITTGKPLCATPDEFLNQEGFVVIHSFMKIPLFDFSQNPVAILTLVFDSTAQKNLDSLRKIYNKLYNNSKEADHKFLEFVGFNKNEVENVTTRELDFILSLRNHKALKGVALDLDISIKGVEALCARLRKALNCHTTAELLDYFTDKLTYEK